ncbi:methylcrotonoyl-CoA carboxylase [Paracoccaceae bacterium]|nr:methylcrotonoyl-CoA carboxylase [Paracoccaceae bacterium]
MKIVGSSRPSNSKIFEENYATMESAIKKVDSLARRIIKGGSESSRARHLKRGKMLPRDRVGNLLDSGSFFLEVGLFAAHGEYKDEVPSAGAIAGVGLVSKRLCMIICNDATVKGGSYYPLTVKKHLRAQEIAAENNLPCIYLVDSGGANLPSWDDVFPDKNHFGRIFFNQSQMSARGIPQIAVVMGSCTAGGAYLPAMSDQTIIVKNQGTIFLAGPPLLKQATGEIIDAETLGGGDTHARLSGVADYLADNDEHAISLTRMIIDDLSSISEYKRLSDNLPLLDPNDLPGFVNADSKKGFDIFNLIGRIVDESKFSEFKATYGETLVCGFAKICGIEVGIIGNNGVLFSESSKKGAHFIELCCQRKIPLLFLQNITGFMVGKKYEQTGIASDGAKLVHAVSCANVPKITVIVGGSYGAGNYGMCGRAFGPRFVWTWPNAKVAVMGGEQAAGVMAEVNIAAAKSKGKKLSEKEISSIKRPILDMFARKSEATFASAHLWDDGIIDPRKTREVIGLSLEIAINAPIQSTRFGVFRM